MDERILFGSGWTKSIFGARQAEASSMERMLMVSLLYIMLQGLIGSKSCNCSSQGMQVSFTGLCVWDKAVK